MKILRLFLLGLLAASLLTGCGVKRNLFVLLPDQDGKVGEITVSSRGGEQVLSQSGQATGLDAADQAPAKPEAMDKEKIQDLFGAALAASPAPPVHFMLYFESGTDQLTQQSATMIQSIIVTIGARKSTDTSVVGHTDTVGKAEFNRSLSLERANAVAQILISKGVDAGILQITSHGEENLLVRTPDETPEPKNRRVEVTVR